MSKDENTESDSQSESLKAKLRCNEEQYKLLKECSKNQDIATWNQWRKDNKDKIWLQGASLGRLKLEKADLRFAHLQGADLSLANLQRTNFAFAHLEGTILCYANLQGADLSFTRLQGAELRNVILNSTTEFLNCHIDRNTDFRDTALESARIKSGTKYLLKYNIRRMNWENWYCGQSGSKLLMGIRQLITAPVRLFWWISNYGISTMRIFITFFSLAILFALVYWINPELVIFSNNINIDKFQSLWHACYFSVVTMTTLGFGDIAANPNSWQGQGILMLQVILGYMLLGALITRLADLFTTEGPAGRFRLMDNETRKLVRRLKEERENREKLRAKSLQTKKMWFKYDAEKGFVEIKS